MQSHNLESICQYSKTGLGDQEWWHLVPDEEGDTFQVIQEWKRLNINGHVDSGYVSYGMEKLKLTQPLIYALAQVALLNRGISLESAAELEN